MKKFQIGKLTFKNFLLHWGVAILLTLIGGLDFFRGKKIETIIVFVLVGSLLPGMLSSILLIGSIKEFMKAIKNKNYLAIVAMILFLFLFTKYFFKL